MSIRSAHTDVKVPDFSEYRNEYSENPVQSTKDNADDRKTYSYITTFSNLKVFFSFDHDKVENLSIFN